MAVMEKSPSPVPAKVYLTNREHEVVRLISLGCTTTDVANILGVAEPTVDTHRTKAMAKIGVKKVATLTRYAIRHRVSTINDDLTPSEKRLLTKAKKRKTTPKTRHPKRKRSAK